MKASDTGSKDKQFTIADTAPELFSRLAVDPAVGETVTNGLVEARTYDSLVNLEEEFLNGVTKLNDLYQSIFEYGDQNDRRKNNRKAKKALKVLRAELREARREVNRQLKQSISSMMHMLELDRKQLNSKRKETMR